MNINNQLDALKLSFNDSKEYILKTWDSLPLNLKTKENKLLVKALLDSYYNTTLQFYPDLNQLLPAGFFDDSLEPGVFNYKDDYFTTPIFKLLHRYQELKDSKKPFVVMLNTGSYSPIHMGHLQMMESAFETLSSQYTVLGGYLSPSHDKYVSQKYSGTAAYHSDARIDLCETFIYNHPYLMIDPWEARYNNVPINFTDVIIHIKKILSKFIPVPIHIAYVFGSDNAGFTWAFIKEDISVCFERPGYELPFNILKKDLNLDSSRYFFIEHKNNFYSSKSIREGSIHFLSDNIKQLYFQFKNNQFPIYSNSYLIRDDSSYCLQNLPYSNEQVQKFKTNLITAFKNAFNPYIDMNILMLNIHKQNDYLNSEYFNDKNILNADLWTKHPNEIKFDITRLFYLSDGQVSSEQLIPRIGKPNLKKQLEHLNKFNITFVDDDIASGKTVSMVKNLLPENYFLSEIISLSQQSFYEDFHFEQSYNFHDIVDFRDFLIGSKEGGLTVELPDEKIGKAPYVWPYVSLSHRAKIPHLNQLAFSLAIWQINKDFFDSFSTTLYLKDLDSNFISFVKSLNFDLNMSVSEFCDFHIKLFK